MEKIIVSHSLKNKLNELSDILFYKEYFGFKEDASNYVQRIRDFIETIPTKPLRQCKNPKYGKYFVRYDNKKSKMQFFITFNTNNNRFFIKDIISPKTKEYETIIGLK